MHCLIAFILFSLHKSLSVEASTASSMEDIYDKTKHHVPGNTHMLSNWSSQGMQDDAVWLVSSAFTIFTMTSGFGLLESGRASVKDEINIMVKNCIDVIFGGLAYWMFGFGLSFGNSNFSNPYVGVGSFFFDPEREEYDEDEKIKGWSYASFIYQLSFCTMCTAIMSSGTTERVHLRSYIVMSFVMPFIHAIPAHWVWAEDGILYKTGAIDWGGCSAVHLVGGTTALVSTLYLRPRQNRFGKKRTKTMSNPNKALLGTFMLWTGWFASNTSSTYGVSYGKYQLATKSAVSTVMCSTGGGVASLVVSHIIEKKVKVEIVIDGFLASLVSSTACCPCLSPLCSVIVGFIGASLSISTHFFLEWAEVDDPVGVIPVHFIAGCFGMLSAGIFAKIDEFNDEVTRGQNGLLYGGGFSLLGKQLLAILAISAWSAFAILVLMVSLQKSPLGLRLTKYEELIGADLREHGLHGVGVNQYLVENKLTTETLSMVLIYYIRWKLKAKRSAEIRHQLQTARFDNEIPMNVMGRSAREAEETARRRMITTKQISCQ